MSNTEDVRDVEHRPKHVEYGQGHPTVNQVTSKQDFRGFREDHFKESVEPEEDTGHRAAIPTS